MPGRKLLMIINNKLPTGDDMGNTRVAIGERDVFHTGTTLQGFGLEKYESIRLPVDDSIIVYAVQDNDTQGNEGDADLRTIELA